MRKHSILFILLVLFFAAGALPTFAQTITGPTSVTTGTTSTFTLFDDVVLTNPNWAVDNGVLLSQTHSGLNHTASIRFDCPGTSTVTLRDGMTVLYTLPLVTVTCRSVNAPSTTFTYVTGCGTGSITRNSSPTGDTWYWQTEPNGTSTSLGSASTLNITTSGTYYLSALKNASSPCCWSATSLATIFVDIAPPTATASAQSICSGQSTSIAITGTAGATFAWTVTQSNVTGATSGSGTTINQTLTATSNFTGTAVYRITPTKGSCNGTPVNVTAIVNPLPIVSATNQAIFSGQSTSIAIANPNNVSGTTFTWTVDQINASGGTSGSGSTIAQTLSGTGTASYSITPNASGCAGTSVSAVVTLHANPTITPSNPRISVGKVTLDGGTGFDTYSWKNAADHEVSTAQTYSTSAPGNYYLTVTKTGVIGSAIAFTTLLDQLEGVNMNYVVTNSILTSVTIESSIADLPIENHSQGIQYFDGLGRPIQNVVTQGSPLKKDIVQPIVYDQFSRESKKYLPVVTNSLNGWYKPNLIDAAGNYLNNPSFVNPYSNGHTDKISDDTRPFSETIFEASPLGRPLQDFGPGQQWKDNNKAVTNRYLVNVDGTGPNEERIIAWDVDVNGMPIKNSTTNAFVSGGFYLTGQLSIKSTKDEHGNEVREYVDKEGHTILKKVQVFSGIAQTNNDSHWAHTYYIYDDLGNLRVVLPPEAVKAMTAN